jgi:DNA-directed RNA polymerase subunit RPC12/RpoP
MLSQDKHVCPKCGTETHITRESHAHENFYIQCDACGHRVAVVRLDAEVISEVANALQAAVLLMAQLQAQALQPVDDIRRLRDMVRRAFVALRVLRLQ